MQLAVQRANNAKFKGFGGWGVPSQGQVNDLFSPLRAPNRDSITAYIGNVFGNVPVPRPWIWDSDTTPQRYCHKKGRYIVCDRKTAWRGVSTDDLSNAVHPSYNGEVDIQAEYRGAQGGLILVRKTGDQGYL